MFTLKKKLIWRMQMLRDRARLYETPNYLLKDMGLSRSDIPYITRTRDYP